jgi:hypothetical protein
VIVGRFARPSVDPADPTYEGVADEDVVDRLAAAADHVAEGALLRDQRSEVPQPRAAALVAPLEAGVPLSEPGGPAGVVAAAGSSLSPPSTISAPSRPSLSSSDFVSASDGIRTRDRLDHNQRAPSRPAARIPLHEQCSARWARPRPPTDAAR